MEITQNSITIKLTPQEQSIINYLNSKEEVSWEELAQFAKDPQNVKKCTLQKKVSEIKRIYIAANLSIPFNCRFASLAAKQEAKTDLVKIRITAGGNRVPSTNLDSDVKIDFKLNPIYKRITTKNGTYNLSTNEWELFTFLYEKAGEKISVEQMKDVVYKNFGSKTPHNWHGAIMGTLTKLRRNIPELKTQDRLSTMVGSNTTYYMLK